MLVMLHVRILLDAGLLTFFFIAVTHYACVDEVYTKGLYQALLYYMKGFGYTRVFRR